MGKRHRNFVPNAFGEIAQEAKSTFLYISISKIPGCTTVVCSNGKGAISLRGTRAELYAQPVAKALVRARYASGRTPIALGVQV